MSEENLPEPLTSKEYNGVNVPIPTLDPLLKIDPVVNDVALAHLVT